MSAELFIYLAYVIDSLGKTLVVLGIAAFLIAAFFGIVFAHQDNRKDAEEAAAKAKKYLMAAGIIMGLISFLPPERTLYMIAGAHLGKEAIQSETAQKIQKIINGKLDKYLDELEGKK